MFIDGDCVTMEEAEARKTQTTFAQYRKAFHATLMEAQADLEHKKRALGEREKALIDQERALARYEEELRRRDSKLAAALEKLQAREHALENAEAELIEEMKALMLALEAESDTDEMPE